MTKVKAVKGLGWSCGAVSNSEWTGVRLRDVLEHAGVDVDDPARLGVEHVQFEGERWVQHWQTEADAQVVSMALCLLTFFFVLSLFSNCVVLSDRRISSFVPPCTLPGGST